MQNTIYEEIVIGQSASISRTLTERDLFLFAEASGDTNPIHIDPAFAAGTMFGERIAHGAWTGALISALLGAKFPGPGTIYLSQQLSFRAPVKLGDTVAIKVTVTDKRDDRKFVTLACEVTNQNGKTVAKGMAEVIAPSEKVQVPAPKMPTISIG